MRPVSSCVAWVPAVGCLSFDALSCASYLGQCRPNSVNPHSGDVHSFSEIGPTSGD